MSFTKVALSLQAAAFVAAQTYTGTNGVYTVTADTGGDVPLASKVFDYPDLPYQADSGDGPRGTEQGYNICNSTTLGDSSLCETAFINSVDDFCLWGSPIKNETVADVEEEMVAYCTTDQYGTRVLPEGALQGVQFIQTPGYVQVVGMIDQTALNLQADDYGGEEDPHGADQRGNPLGSLLYSLSCVPQAFGPGPKSNYTQIHEWSYFIGGGIFCFKACDPAGENAARLCEHVYDRIGCTYNAPSDYGSINGTFQSCEGDNQLPAGVYVTDGATSTYYQPAESLGAITSIPYTASVPASSSCTSYTSSSLFTGLQKASGTASAASAASSGATSANTDGAAAASSQTTGAAAAVSGAKKAASDDQGSSATSNAVASMTAIAFALFAGLQLA